MGERAKCGRADTRRVVFEDGDQVRHKSIELGLVGQIPPEVEEKVERADDSCRAEAVAEVGADEREQDERGSVYRPRLPG